MENMNLARESIKTTHGLQLAVWKHPLPKIAQAHDVSVASLEYRIHHEEIIKPPPEYWEKIQRGLSHHQTLREIGWTRPMIQKIKAILLDAKSQMK
jgi:hypothetical protein